MSTPRPNPSSDNGIRRRLRVVIRGAVQGVGFRPFVYRSATSLGLNGWVINSAQGVIIETEGMDSELERFLEKLHSDKPPRSSVQSLEYTFLDPVGYDTFEIHASDEAGPATTLVLPDIATCPDCLREIFDPLDRRYRYPFTNCTNCGPRFSIINALPYDRQNTSMSVFDMCPRCRAEYDNPLNRRFHAQPNACADCGPWVELWDGSGRPVATRDAALAEAVRVIRDGGILALKGLGGFQLIVDARRDEAVRRLRSRKQREEKPLALMVPSAASAGEHCIVSPPEARLLESPESPIVLLTRGGSSPVTPSVAPANPCLGVMLPYTPLHHILMTDLGFPVVATSGNLTDEPICTGDDEAVDRLGMIADRFLVHNRPIVRHVDDSVVRVVAGRPLVLRRARGYAPLPIMIGGAGTRQRKAATSGVGARLKNAAALGVGAHLKNTVALAVDGQVFLGQHNGDLSTSAACSAFERSAADLGTLYRVEPAVVACDLHPDYRSTRFAADIARTPRRIQHHVAHVFACMAENELAPPVSGVAWDGTGLGTDGTVWGGEFLAIRPSSFERAGHLRTFLLPGGESAVREPRRTALALLYELFSDEALEMGHLAPVRAFSKQDLRVLGKQLARRVNAPVTSSIGRLFDAVASLLGLRQIAAFEGQAAMELEFAATEVETEDSYPFGVDAGDDGFIIDWEPLVRGVITDLSRSVDVGAAAARFHNTLVDVIVEAAKRMNEERVVLTGGCFQNKYLTERAVARLGAAHLRPYWHQRVPPNDGGISLGQVVAAVYLNG